MAKHYDSKTLLTRALKGAHWGDDAPILARVVLALEDDLKHLVKDMFSVDIPVKVNLDRIFKKAVADWKKARKEDDEHHNAVVMYPDQVKIEYARKKKCQKQT